jgi:CMP-N-acetylneuraminic acid synthetase
MFMKKLCTICARGGSKGIKNKNILTICGKPLIAHSILQARKSNLFDYVVVSSDSPTIREIALEWGADYAIDRPSELASDTAAKLPAIQHAVLVAEEKLNQNTPFDIIVDLDSTSPLRLVSDIQNAMIQFQKTIDAENLITAMAARRSPYFNMIELNKDGKVSLVKKMDPPPVRRQDAPACFDMNASIYMWKRSALFSNQGLFTDKTVLFVMPEERSIDIDSEFDLQIVKIIAETRQDLVSHDAI